MELSRERSFVTPVRHMSHVQFTVDGVRAWTMLNLMKRCHKVAKMFCSMSTAAEFRRRAEALSVRYSACFSLQKHYQAAERYDCCHLSGVCYLSVFILFDFLVAHWIPCGVKNDRSTPQLVNCWLKRWNYLIFSCSSRVTADVSLELSIAISAAFGLSPPIHSLNFCPPQSSMFGVLDLWISLPFRIVNLKIPESIRIQRWDHVL